MSKSISVATLLMVFVIGITAAAQNSEIQEGELFGDAAETTPEVTLEEMSRKLVEQQKLIDDLQEKIIVMEESLARLLETAGSSEDLLGAMSSAPEMRRVLGKATQGKLHILNFRGVPTEIYVNGTLWSARPNRSFVYVPMGTVTVQQRSRLDEPPHIFEARDWQEQADGTLALTDEIHQ